MFSILVGVRSKLVVTSTPLVRTIVSRYGMDVGSHIKDEDEDKTVRQMDFLFRRMKREDKIRDRKFDRHVVKSERKRQDANAKKYKIENVARKKLIKFILEQRAKWKNYEL